MKIFFFKKSKIGHGGPTQNRILRRTTVTEFSKTFLVFYKWPDLTDVQGILCSTVGGTCTINCPILHQQGIGEHQGLPYCVARRPYHSTPNTVLLGEGTSEYLQYSPYFGHHSCSQAATLYRYEGLTLSQRFSKGNSAREIPYKNYARNPTCVQL